MHPMPFSFISSEVVKFLFYYLYSDVVKSMHVKVFVYRAVCMSVHVISVVSKSYSEVL